MQQPDVLLIKIYDQHFHMLAPTPASESRHCTSPLASTASAVYATIRQRSECRPRVSQQVPPCVQFVINLIIADANIIETNNQ